MIPQKITPYVGSVPNKDESGLWLYFSGEPEFKLLGARYRFAAGDLLGTASPQTKHNPKGFTWSKATRAFCLFFLDFLIYCSKNRDPEKHEFSDPAPMERTEVGRAQSLGFRIAKGAEWLQSLFMSSKHPNLSSNVFENDNIDGKDRLRPIRLTLKNKKAWPMKQIRIYVAGVVREPMTLEPVYRAIENQEPAFVIVRKIAAVRRNSNRVLEKPPYQENFESCHILRGEKPIVNHFQSISLQAIRAYIVSSRYASNEIKNELVTPDCFFVIAEKLSCADFKSHQEFFSHVENVVLDEVKFGVAAAVTVHTHIQDAVVQQIIEDPKLKASLKIFPPLWSLDMFLRENSRYWPLEFRRKLDTAAAAYIAKNRTRIAGEHGERLPGVIELIKLFQEYNLGTSTVEIMEMCVDHDCKYIKEAIKNQGEAITEFWRVLTKLAGASKDFRILYSDHLVSIRRTLRSASPPFLM